MNRRLSIGIDGHRFKLDAFYDSVQNFAGICRYIVARALIIIHDLSQASLSVGKEPVEFAAGK